MGAAAIGERVGALVESGGFGVAPRRSVLVHYTVVRQGEEGFEVLRVPLSRGGEALPVFSVGWAARAYGVARADEGWYAKAYDAAEITALLDSLGDSVGWVALDPDPDRRVRGGAANVMPRERFVDYLSCFRESVASLPFGGFEDEDAAREADVG